MTKALETLNPADVAALTEILRPIISAVVQSDRLALPYDLSFRFNSAPAASEIIDYLVSAVPIRLPANAAGSVGYVDVNPSALYILFLRRGGNLADPNSGDIIATISISDTGSFSFSTAGGLAIDIAVGALLKLVGPATADVGIRGVAFTMPLREID